MGLNIVVKDFSKRDKWKCHPDIPNKEWDCLRMQGDKEITSLLLSFGIENSSEDDSYFRPRDLSNLALAVDAFENYIGVNKGRWILLIQLLEANPSYWIYFSY